MYPLFVAHISPCATKINFCGAYGAVRHKNLPFCGAYVPVRHKNHPFCGACATVRHKNLLGPTPIIAEWPAVKLLWRIGDTCATKMLPFCGAWEQVRHKKSYGAHTNHCRWPAENLLWRTSIPCATKSQVFVAHGSICATKIPQQKIGRASCRERVSFIG